MGGNNNDGNQPRGKLVPSTSTADNKFYLNKMVIIIGGRSIGLKGKVANIANRGWWTIDNPKLEGKKVTAKLCRLLDGMPASHVKYYESKIGTVQSGRVDPMDDGEDSDTGALAHLRVDGRRPKRTKSYRASYSSVKKYRSRGHSGAASRSGRDSLTFPFAPPEKAAGTTDRPAVSVQPPTGDKARNVRYKTHRHIQSKYPPVLQPVILDPQEERCFQRAESLAHLEPDSIIEIFNRKTGRIMRGKDGIKVADLSSVLRRHAEYEPLIPIPSLETTAVGERKMDPCAAERGANNDHHLARMARSSKNTRVSAVVRPQITASNSIAEGRFITVEAGPYRGLIGRVVSCSPEGWCMISDLLDDENQKPDVVVHSRMLRLIPTMSEIEIRDSLGNSSRDNIVAYHEMKKNSNETQKTTDKTDANALKEDEEKKGTCMQDKSNILPLLENHSHELDKDLPGQQINGSRIEASMVEAQVALNVQQLAEQMLGVR